MVAGYVHVEVVQAQSPKRPEGPCGDLLACDRTAAATTLICADGVGSGVRARIAAEMCVSRLRELLRLEFSLRKGMASLVHTMEHPRDPARPFAAFSVARILNDGMTTVLGYEAPPPVLVSRRHASLLAPSPIELGGGLVQEYNCYLEPGDGLLLVSDGITQAGLVTSVPDGWTAEGAVRFLNGRLVDGLATRDLPDRLHREALRLWAVAGDDCTAALALCRRGQIVNLLTGPPSDPSLDVATVRRFMQSEGLKIVCGGTTAEIVARAIGVPLRVEQEPKSLVAPPRYEITGVDLVTEGAVTLNQVYNLLDEDLRHVKEDSGVIELCMFLQIADRVNVLVGGARNKANDDIAFRQRGILSRHQILPLLLEKLRAAEKLVVLQQV